MHRIVMIMFMVLSCPLLAEEVRYCDPAAGLAGGLCPVEQSIWWTCGGHPRQEQRATAKQREHLEKFGLGIFFPELPNYGLEHSSAILRNDLIKRFGKPLNTSSKERLAYDPGDPMEIVTTWEYRGFRITTVASKPKPDEFGIEQGEIYDASISLRYGVRIGQPIDQWAKQFGRPSCREEGLVNGKEYRLNYSGEHFFACGENKDMPCVSTYDIDLVLDASGKVQRIWWSHPML